MKRAYNVISGLINEPPMYIGLVIAHSLMEARRQVNNRIYKQTQQPDYVSLEQVARLPDETPDYIYLREVGVDAQII